MKLLVAVTLMVVGSIAHAAADTAPGVEMLMLNKNPQPSIGDRIALQEVKGISAGSMARLSKRLEVTIWKSPLIVKFAAMV